MCKWAPGLGREKLKDRWRQGGCRLSVSRGAAPPAPALSPQRSASKVGLRFLILLLAVSLIPQLLDWRPSAPNIILLFPARLSTQLASSRVAVRPDLAEVSLCLGVERLGSFPALLSSSLRLALRDARLWAFEPLRSCFAVGAEHPQSVGRARHRWACLGRRARGEELGELWGPGSAQCLDWVLACDCAPFSVSLWRFL